MSLLTGTSGNDVIVIEAVDTTYPTVDQVQLGGGDDLLTISEIARRKMLADGGPGHDTLIGGLGGEALFGSSGNDVISGRGGSDNLKGGSGDDIISGGSIMDSRAPGVASLSVGRDAIYGGSGNDTLMVGDGNDWFYGGSGYDTLSFERADTFTYTYSSRTGEKFTPLTTGATVDLSKSISKLGAATHTIDSIENVIGTHLADTITGSKNANVLNGGAGNDTIRSLGGADTLTGGSGADKFVYLKKDHADGSVDTITDFGVGADVLDIRDFYKGHEGKAIDSMVRVTEVAGGSMVSIKAHGAFIDVVKLIGVQDMSAADMLADGMLLI